MLTVDKALQRVAGVAVGCCAPKKRGDRARVNETGTDCGARAEEREREAERDVTSISRPFL